MCVIKKKYFKNQNGSRRGPYLYEYKNVREGAKVKSIYVRYIGVGVSRPTEELRIESQVADSNLARSLEAFSSGEVMVAFDFETTGFSEKTEAPIELAAVRFRVVDGEIEIIDRWSTLSNPGKRIPGQIQRLTHITQEMVKDAPDVETAYRRFREYTGTRRLFLGQNIEFDMRFFNALGVKYGYQEIPKSHQLDTLDLSRSLYPDARHHTLGDISRREGLRTAENPHSDTSVEGAFHRATTDCELTARAWASMLRKVKDNIRN